MIGSLDIRERMKLREPMGESIKRAENIVHIQHLVAGGKKHWTQSVMPELLEAANYISSTKRNSCDTTGNAYFSFDQWRKHKRSASRLFPAALIFTAAAHKCKLRNYLKMQNDLNAAINNHRDQIKFCTHHIDRDKYSGLLDELVAPPTQIFRKEDFMKAFEAEEDEEKEEKEEEEEEKNNEKKEEKVESRKEDEEDDEDDEDSVFQSNSSSVIIKKKEEVNKIDTYHSIRLAKKEQEEKELREKEKLEYIENEIRINENKLELIKMKRLKKFGTRSSDFLHGYPVVLESSVLLDAVLIHYSRVGMVHEELLIGRKENECSIQLEMVSTFQGK